MQTHFEAASDPNVVASVAKEIIYTRIHCGSIIYLEFLGCGSTFQSLFDLTKGYKHRARVIKDSDDGSDEVIKCLKRRNFFQNNLRICGVNTDCCVYSTVEGLLEKLPYSKIQIIKNACNSYGEDKIDWRGYIKHKNLRLV